MDSKETRQEYFEKMDEAQSILFNWILSLEVLPEEYKDKIDSICESIKELNKEYTTDNEELILYSLKMFAQQQATWSKAGEISGVRYFGLEKYCNEHDIDSRLLRLDEYLNVTDEDVVRDEWRKLAPEVADELHLTREPLAVFNSDRECNHKHLNTVHNSLYYKYRLSEFAILLNETIYDLQVDYSKVKYIIRKVEDLINYSRVSDGDELGDLIEVIKKANKKLYDSTCEDDVMEACNIILDNAPYISCRRW